MTQPWSRPPQPTIQMAGQEPSKVETSATHTTTADAFKVPGETAEKATISVAGTSNLPAVLESAMTALADVEMLQSADAMDVDAETAAEPTVSMAGGAAVPALGESV